MYNHIYLNSEKNYHSDHFELLKINPFNYDINIINNNKNTKIEKKLNNYLNNISNN